MIRGKLDDLVPVGAVERAIEHPSEREHAADAGGADRTVDHCLLDGGETHPLTPLGLV